MFLQSSWPGVTSPRPYGTITVFLLIPCLGVKWKAVPALILLASVYPSFADRVKESRNDEGKESIKTYGSLVYIGQTYPIHSIQAQPFSGEQSPFFFLPPEGS